MRKKAKRENVISQKQKLVVVPIASEKIQELSLEQYKSFMKGYKEFRNRYSPENHEIRMKVSANLIVLNNGNRIFLEHGPYEKIKRKMFPSFFGVAKKKNQNKHKPEKSLPLDSFITASANILPKAVREEFKGDLMEIRSEMKGEGYGNGWINFTSIGKIILVIFATLKIKLSDFVHSKKERNK